MKTDDSPQKIAEHIMAGASIDSATACALARSADQQALWAAADELRRYFMGNQFHLCSIINARSGNCTENCRFCAQSARHHTGAITYGLIDRELAISLALDNDAHGVHRLSLVTSGHSVDKATWKELAKLYAEINRKTSLELCASMGFLDQERAEQLEQSGITRYHCNLETNAKRFSKICSTHSWQDKVDTLTIAAEAGMSVCSGGIIGMGENMEDRIELALELLELGVQSIPINILTPIAGTPFAELEPLSAEEILTTIALFRFINPDAVIRIAGGRQQLGKEQYRCFAAGANGAIVGNYLTTTGSSITEDIEALKKMGFMFKRAGG
ncbi:MAG: biotin synthase BioB [Candidatus Electrothrix sp. AX5]|jgi:biotin synthase|uniref:Biotin synthase n=1 Tax=Candidatus Electrothrix aarhusensis TaxID=1859131 RepID=A0A3S3QIW3_9BACT|nr:biotin synthase BioB [Candidatus Electrothrix sp. AX5]RWX45750.1 biotin synthase [Candidatus Electrothrix aarhusensis]